MSKGSKRKRSQVNFRLSSQESNATDDDDDDESPVEDELARKHIRTLTERLYDLRERFMEVVQKINNDITGFEDVISDEEDKNETESSSEEEELSTEYESSSSSNENDQNKAMKFSPKTCKLAKARLESIVQRKFRQFSHLKHLLEYPKIVHCLIYDESDRINIPLRYLDPFISAHVSENPNGKIYDQVKRQIEDLHRVFRKDRE